MYKKIYQVGVALTVMATPALAQQTEWQQINKAYKTGMELYERGKFSSASAQFDRVEALRTKSNLQLDETEELFLC